MKKRIDIDEMFMNIALQVAERSTCSRVQVGAVIVKDQRIISMGWNGVPSGKSHCNDVFHKKFEEEKPEMKFEEWIQSDPIKQEHHHFAVENEIHSEMNAMLFAAKNGIAIDGSDLYVVWSPCINCAKSLLQVGIKNVYYNKKYERDPRGVEFLESNGVKCFQIDLENHSILRSDEGLNED